MSRASDELENHKDRLTELTGDAQAKLDEFKQNLATADNLDELGRLDYNPLLEAVQEIETVVDNVPDEDDLVEDEEEV